MAADNKQIAADVLKAVGGPGNITQAMHCMTRLRLTLADKSVPDADAMKKIPGVLGAQWVGEQFQVIIGQNVPKVYEEVLAAGVNAGGSVDEAPDTADADPLTPKKVLDNALNYLSKTMVAAIPIMTAAAMFRTVAIVIGPLMLGLVAEDSSVYQFLYNWMFDAGFYFLPIYLGYSAATTLGASPMLGMMCGGILLAPEMIDMVNAGEVTETLVYGFVPAPVASYAQTVLPILLTVAAMYFIEKFFKRVIPDTLSTVFVPWLTMVVVTPLSLGFLSPLGSWLGAGLAGGLAAFADAGGFIAVAVIAAAWQFIIVTGMHVAIFGLILPSFMALGYDPCVLVAAFISVAAGWGMSFGAFLKLKEPEEKAAEFGYTISGVLGGVNEPLLYGCGFKYMRPLVGLVAGGFAGGLFAGLMGVRFYVFGATNILGLINFAGGGPQNLAFACVSYAIAFVVAAAVVYFFGFTKEQIDEDRAAAAAAKKAA